MCLRPSDLFKIAKNSNCLRLQVGAVGTDSKGNQFAGWNHMENGSPCEIDMTRSKPTVTHAEIHVLKQSDDIQHLSVTHSPCLACAIKIHTAGVQTVEYVEEYRSLDGIDFLRQVGVNVKRVNNLNNGVKPIINQEEF